MSSSICIVLSVRRRRSVGSLSLYAPVRDMHVKTEARQILSSNTIETLARVRFAWVPCTEVSIRFACTA